MTYSLNNLAYCSNVHPGEDVEAVIQNIQTHFVAVKQRRNLQDMASGLWLSYKAANALRAKPALFNRFKQVLKESGLRLTSLNGFPFGDFHQAVVKQNVYLPTWADRQRLEYTQSLAEILASCLPSDENKGAISTLPLAYAADWSDAQQQMAISQFIHLANFLAELEQQTNKQIVICIEMEPDCVLQHTEQLTGFFIQQLLPAAEQIGVTKETILRYIGCCYDTCHQAVMGENITESLQQITYSGIQIGKIQISNAIQANIDSIEQVQQLTELFADKKFLHQTKVFINNELVEELADLSFEQLEQARERKTNEDLHSITATIHYHIPVNQNAADLPLSFVSATQGAILQTLDFLQTHQQYRPFLEIETYTWLNFLQQEIDKNASLHAGFAAEFSWLEQALLQRNML
ncbi:metabolite traffic protein EboE [Paraglaciecola sp. L3A3]|uniref:metabolite traffic protein EboE n=1 Tax=Paraglaciecola sp. L3A3 TaxID=2686358 RepID=UPI00131B49EB|nr:metabolite traffic protein EboE [Paraglaciecola sp. L3A3]